MQAISNLKHRLDFFGYGGYADAENSSAMIDLEGSIVLIDCGNTVGKTIEYFQHNKYRINDISIVITHMHADHVGGLPTLLQFLKYNTETKVRIITTVLMEQSLKCLLKLCGVDFNEVEFTVSSRYVRLTDKVKLRMIRTRHSKDVCAYGILFTDKQNNYNLYYSGDSKYVPTKIMKMLIRGKINEYYQDITFYEKSEVHMSMKYLKERVLPLINENTEVYHYHNRHGWREV